MSRITFSSCEVMGLTGGNHLLSSLNFTNSSSSSACINIQGGANVTIQNSSFQSSSISNIRVSGKATLRIKDSIITSGKSTQNNGIHLTLNSSLILSNTTITGLTGSSGYPAIYCEQSTMDIKLLRANNNVALSNGGAIVMTNCSVTCDQCEFINNTVIGSGGAIYAIGSSSLNITKSIFNNNSATYYGGAINVNSGSPFFLSNSTFSGNTIPSTGKGAALYIDRSRSSITSSFFSVNFGPSSVTVNSPTTFVDCQFLSNTGGNALSSANSTFVSSSFFLNNVGGATGGGIYAQGFLSISSSLFRSNEGGSGSALFALGGLQATINNTTIQSNKGGAILIDTSTSSSSTVNITNSLLYDNNNEGKGGALVTVASSTPNFINFKNVTCSNNVGMAGGGCLYIGKGSFFNIASSTISYNSGSLVSGSGGGIYLEDGSLEMRKTYVIKNIALSGGGIFVTSSVLTQSTRILHCNFNY